MSVFTAGIIIIGDEILSGRTKDTNANFIAKNLITYGIKLEEIKIIQDNTAIIIESVKLFSDKYNYVFTTGGIGPTHDDITSESIAEAFDKDYKITDLSTVSNSISSSSGTNTLHVAAQFVRISSKSSRGSSSSHNPCPFFSLHTSLDHISTGINVPLPISLTKLAPLRFQCRPRCDQSQRTESGKGKIAVRSSEIVSML
mgnify:CR=1 FL=1